MKRILGSTGITVNAVGFGVWQLSNYDRPTEDEAVDIIRRAVECSADFFDTADCYCTDDNDFGHNERLIGRALKRIDEHSITVATKAGYRRPGGRWVADGRPERIMACCDASLERLGLNSIPPCERGYRADQDDRQLATRVVPGASSPHPLRCYSLHANNECRPHYETHSLPAFCLRNPDRLRWRLR